MPETWMFGASWWMFIKTLLLCKIVHVSLFFSTRETSNIECTGQWQGLVYIWNWKGTPKQSHVISDHYKSLERFHGSSVLIWLNRCIENQIFLRNSFSPIADIHMLKCFFIDQSNLYKWIKCVPQVFDLTGNR